MSSISEESLGLGIFRMHFYPILTSVNPGLAYYNSAYHLPLRKDPHILQYYAFNVPFAYIYYRFVHSF